MRVITEILAGLASFILMLLISLMLIAALAYDDGDGNFTDDFYTDFSIERSISVEADE